MADRDAEFEPEWRSSEGDWPSTDDDDLDDDWPDEDESAELVPCPNCGSEIYEEAEQCPVCGEYVTPERPSLDGRPAWFLLLGLAGIVAVILALSGLGRVLF